MKTLFRFWVGNVLEIGLNIDWRTWALPLMLDLSGGWKQGEKDIYVLCFLIEICHGYDREGASISEPNPQKAYEHGYSDGKFDGIDTFLDSPCRCSLCEEAYYRGFDDGVTSAIQGDNPDAR
jgi:hypothetical protein